MHAEGKRKIIYAAGLLCAGALVGCICTLLYCGSGRTSSTGAGCTSAAQQVSRITELNELAERENQSAGEAVTRASERAAEAGAINQRVTERLADSKELLGQIRADNQRAKQILGGLIGETESGCTQREKN